MADGLGYYSYLPAKFIYNDKNFEFKWFDEVFDANYEDHLFEKPTQNFMVKYKDRMINLYYPGQSFLQFPFFFLAHVSAKLFDYPPDGFSFPYQLGMGIAAMFYTLLGLFFLQKLLFNVSQNRRLSIYFTLLVFFATNLFTYSIFAGCYTHCYSFAFISISLFFAQKFFNQEESKLFNLLAFATSAAIVIFLRPVNIILLISTLYFFKTFPLARIFNGKKNVAAIGAVFLLFFFVVIYNMGITYLQTKSLIANTYTIGAFYFNDWSHVWDNFFGFQNGILWYTPIILLCFIPLLFCRRNPKILFLVAPVLLIILLYSFWFYWNIVNRTLVDFSGILALLLLILFGRVNDNSKVYKTLLLISFLCIPFFQLKAYQLRNGILNSSYTYWHYYARHFFTVGHADVFPINPKTIKQQQDYFYDFEQEEGSTVSSEKAFDGKKSAVLNEQVEYNCSKTFTVPGFFDKSGFKKVKASFWFYRTEEMKNVQFVFSFAKKENVIYNHPFYINTTTKANKWDLKEFGMDLPEDVSVGDKLVVYFWNPDKRSSVFIDNFKLEFVLKDGSDEITLNK